MKAGNTRSVFLNLTEEQKRHLKATAAQRGLTLTALVTRVLTAYDAVGCPPAFRIVPDGPAANAAPELGDGDAAWGWYQLQVVQAQQEHDAVVRQAYERYVRAAAATMTGAAAATAEGGERDPSENTALTADSGAESGAVRSAEGTSSEAGRGTAG